MKILITGSNSYIGESLKEYLSQWSNYYFVDTVSMLDDNWKKKNFEKYDVVFHVAAIVHKKEKPGMKDIYFKVNKELAVLVAEKAKAQGVGQFIFMSTMSVYGKKSKIGKKVIIDENSVCEPNTLYGKSKLEAESELNKLNDKKFKVVILRPPIVYGPNCLGNYGRLKKFVLKMRIFPLVNNERSMVFIDNLSEFIRQIIQEKISGLFFPQNKEYVNTVQMVRLIAKEHSKRVILSKSLALMVKIFSNLDIITKVFGNLVYNLKMSDYNDFSYCISDFEKSIQLTEEKSLKRSES